MDGRQSKHTNIRCNLCGESCDIAEPQEPTDGSVIEAQSMGLIHAMPVGGFWSTPGNGSGALDDLTAYRFSLCEFCLDWLFAQCAVPPELFEVTPFSRATDPMEEPFRPALKRVLEDPWRSNKETFLSEYARRNAARFRAAMAKGQ